ncbi:MAG TPA: hypothetical protein VKA84_26115, partial [Gemmatimonadaceae bacterium]|nr:hypothetical protein [Gemmatimonadaceae bacterium]
MLSVIACAALLAACASAPRERPPVIPAPSPLFEFRSDFWVNLHHFLYARSRVRQGMDARRPALLHVAADTAGFGALPDDARRGWERALAVYDTVLSRRDITFDSAAVELAYALAGRGAEPLDAAWWRASPLRERVRAALEDAAPAYRAALWARHDSANRAWVAEHDALLRQYADTLARQLARTYRWPWPGEPIPVEVVAFAQWAGAYAVEHPSLLTLQSVYELHRGTLGLEQLFHEASHLLMDSVDAAMR